MRKTKASGEVVELLENDTIGTYTLYEIPFTFTHHPEVECGSCDITPHFYIIMATYFLNLEL